MTASSRALLEQLVATLAGTRDSVDVAIAVDAGTPASVTSLELERPSSGSLVLRFRSAASAASKVGGNAELGDFEVEAKDGRRIRFSGRLLGEATSQDEVGLQRWTEVRIYKSDRGNYIATIVGRTTVDGELDRSDALASANPRSIVAFLAKRGFLTIVAREAIDRAAELDPAIATGLVSEA